MPFLKYLHIERVGNDEVEGIEDGTVYVFPKIDGTNASVWHVDGTLYAGSRNREVNAGVDNQGFYTWATSDDPHATALRGYVQATGRRLFGEWLIPHTLKTYREEAWHKFYVFDVAADSPDEDRGYQLLSFYEWSSDLEEAGVLYIPPLKIITNGRADDFNSLLDQNFYLMPDGGELGEGIVLKNYNYRNKYGRQQYAKLVRQEFKEDNVREMGAAKLFRADGVEKAIAVDTVTRTLVDKVIAKIKAEQPRICVIVGPEGLREVTVDAGRSVELHDHEGIAETIEPGWKSQYIPQLLGRVYHDVVTEELWAQLKKHKQPTIDFKLLSRLIIAQVRAVAPEVF